MRNVSDIDSSLFLFYSESSELYVYAVIVVLLWKLIHMYTQTLTLNTITDHVELLF